MNLNITVIYKITNTVNNKIYIGSAFNYRKRVTLHKHLLRNNKHRNKHIQASWNKHKEESFIFEIIEECSKEILIEREQYYLDSLNPQYNIRKIAENNSGLKVSEETKKKISMSHITSPRKTRTTEELIACGFIKSGRRKSQETKDKISKANKGNKPSEFTMQRLAEVKSKKVYQYDLEGNFIKEWKSTREVARFFNIDSTNISRCCKNVDNRQTCKNFKWYYEDNRPINNLI
jgi:group I intron endonuclease